MEKRLSLFQNVSISEDRYIFNGAKIAVPNDAANTARAYVLLQKAGWIKLKEDVNLATASSDDIVENPYNIKFTDVYAGLDLNY